MMCLMISWKRFISQSSAMRAGQVNMGMGKQSILSSEVSVGI